MAAEKECAWVRVGACDGAGQRVGARARVAGEPETSGGAWGCVRG